MPTRLVPAVLTLAALLSGCPPGVIVEPAADPDAAPSPARPDAAPRPEPPPSRPDASAVDAAPGSDAGGLDAPATPDAGPAPPPAYPPGPYGLSVGETAPDLSFTREDGGAVTLADLRRDPSVRMILWSSGAPWCAGCVFEVPKLKSVHARYADAGVLVFETLFENTSYGPATPADVSYWRASHRIDHALGVEPTPPYHDVLRDPPPYTWMIDAETMEVLYFHVGQHGVGQLDSYVATTLPRLTRE